MASTYESPETVVISEAGPTVAALKGVSDVFSTGIKKFGEIRNAEVAANKKRQAELAKDMYINPEKYFERIQKNEGGLALQSQALDLFRKNTELSLQVRNGAGGPEVLQKRNETIKKLNQLIGYAGAETEFKKNWIEQGQDRITNMTNQGGASGLDGKYWSAANILAGVADGKVETTYVNNVQYYTFTGEGLEKPYKVPSVGFLGKQLPKVVQWDKSVKDALAQINIIDEDGKLTMDARKMTEEEYNKKTQDALAKVAIGFAKKDLHSVNSMTVDVMGEENLYSFGGATGEIDPLFAGSVLNKDDQKRFLDSTRKYGMINNVPPHYGIDPKPLSTSEINRIKKKSLFEDNVKAFEDKFLRTLGNFEGGFNAANVIKGGLNIFSKDKNDKVQIDKDDNKILNPKFVEALSYLGGYRVVSTPGEKEAVIKGDNGLDNFTVTDGQPINIFIENLHKKLFEGNSLYDANSAGRFAYQSDFINDKSSEDIKAQYKKFQIADEVE